MSDKYSTSRHDYLGRLLYPISPTEQNPPMSFMMKKRYYLRITSCLSTLVLCLLDQRATPSTSQSLNQQVNVRMNAFTSLLPCVPATRTFVWTREKNPLPPLQSDPNSDITCIMIHAYITLVCVYTLVFTFDVL